MRKWRHADFNLFSFTQNYFSGLCQKTFLMSSSPRPMAVTHFLNPLAARTALLETLYVPISKWNGVLNMTMPTFLICKVLLVVRAQREAAIRAYTMCAENLDIRKCLCDARQILAHKVGLISWVKREYVIKSSPTRAKFTLLENKIVTPTQHEAILKKTMSRAQGMSLPHRQLPCHIFTLLITLPSNSAWFM